MSTSPTPAGSAPAAPSSDARRSLRNAWISVAAIPVAFLVAMVAGQALASLLGYDSGGADPAPFGTMLAAGLSAVLIMVIPAVFAIVFGFRARRRGLPGGLIPAVIAIAAAAWAILTNTVPILVVALTGGLP